MDRSTRKRLYNLCDPAEALAPGDERYADLDALGARGASWCEVIARRIELSDRPLCELLTAPAGAGITTELRRMAARLTADSGLLVVHIDAAEVVDLAARIDAADLLLAIVERTERAVIAGTDRPPSHMRRLLKWLTASDTDRPAETASAAPMESLRDVPKAREKMHLRVDAERSRFLADVRDELTLLDHTARQHGHTGIAVLFDGLEKLTGTTSDWPAVLDSAERIFMRGAPSIALPVHVVYTLPFALLVRLGVPVSVLPMIALTDPGDRARQAGFEAARQIVERRIPTEILDDLFGSERRDEHLHDLIAASGGSPREIVRSLQSVIAEPVLVDGRLARLLAMLAEPLRLGIQSDDAAWLARLHGSHSLDVTNPAERAAAERMLRRGAVFPYQNGKTWFDLHPAVRNAPAMVAALDGRAMRM